MEIYNSTPGYDADVEWTQTKDLLIRHGDIWVGITIGTGAANVLKVDFNPTRYAPINFTNAGLAWDAISQAGAMIKNNHRSFVCREQRLVVESASTAWTSEFTVGEQITIPLKNQDGQFVADDRTLDELEGEGRVVFRYTGWNPNGSRRDIAGITNAARNVVGLMPHPEHAVEPGFGPDGPAGPRRGVDGLRFFTSVIGSLVG